MDADVYAARAAVVQQGYAEACWQAPQAATIVYMH